MRPYAFALAALLAFALTGCGSKSEAPAPKESEHAGHEEGHEEGIRLSDEALKTAGIRSEAVAVRQIRPGLDVPGVIAIPADARAVVTPPVAGKIVRLFAKVGDTVRQGQPLAEIESSDLATATSSIAAAETDVERAMAEVRQRQAAIDLAEGHHRTALAQLDRQKRFANAGAFSQPALQAARSELNEAQSELLSAQAEEATHISQLERAERLFKEGLISQNDLESARLERRQDEVRLSRARSRIDLARRAYEREERIGSEGLVNAREVGAAEAEVRAAKLELDRAKVDLQGARAALDGARRAVRNARASASALRGGASGGATTLTLSAPISGIVTERQATLGQAVERSSDLFDIEDARTVWVTANVPEADVAKVRAGLKVEIATTAYPDRIFPGVIQIVGTRLDPKTRSLPVQCRVDNPEHLLRADLFARVRIATSGTQSVLAVPQTAISGDGDDVAVFLEKEGVFERQKVTLGRRDGQFVEVVEGLNPGDRVAVSGVFTLRSELAKEELKGHED